MLEAITGHRPMGLRRLEFNGHLCFDASKLTLLSQNGSLLKELKIILPDRRLASMLKPLLKELWEMEEAPVVADQGIESSRVTAIPLPGLHSLELLCHNDSRHIDTGLFLSLSPYLTSLRCLKLIGCRWLGCEGIMAAIKATGGQLEELVIDGCNIVIPCFCDLRDYCCLTSTGFSH